MQRCGPTTTASERSCSSSAVTPTPHQTVTARMLPAPPIRAAGRARSGRETRPRRRPDRAPAFPRAVRGAARPSRAAGRWSASCRPVRCLSPWLRMRLRPLLCWAARTVRRRLRLATGRSRSSSTSPGLPRRPGPRSARPQPLWAVSLPTVRSRHPSGRPTRRLTRSSRLRSRISARRRRFYRAPASMSRRFRRRRVSRPRRRERRPTTSMSTAASAPRTTRASAG